MADKSLNVLRFLPRISIFNIRKDPNSPFRPKRRPRGQHGGYKYGSSHKGAKQKMSYTPIGFEGGNTPFMLKTPREPYHIGAHLRRQYPPFSLQQLQLAVESGHIDASQPVDVGTLCTTHYFSLETADRHFGVHLTDIGLDAFKTQLNVEVQHAKEQVIAAIERSGGIITTAYYDIESLVALTNPYRYFAQGKPIPKRQLPPEDAVSYYLDPKNRGYLADPELVQQERLKLAQKYGYELPDYSKDPLYQTLMVRKDPRQVFYGLRPGWLINLRDKIILEPLDPKTREYYELD